MNGEALAIGHAVMAEATPAVRRQRRTATGGGDDDGSGASKGGGSAQYAAPFWGGGICPRGISHAWVGGDERVRFLVVS